MKAHIVQLILSATALAVSAVDDTSNKDTPEPCMVRAWVRAEDLSPDHVSHVGEGELRIKISRAECANQVASVALRLQFDEFGEVKHLKEGAVLPEVRALNQTAPAAYADWTGSDVVLDYRTHDDAMSDPELWAVRAEERRGWTTEATLLDGTPDLSQPIVTPFTVAVPAVNYPPVFTQHRQSAQGPISHHSYSDLGYRYIALVTFVDGRTVDVLAGHTTFKPSVPMSARQAPLSHNVQLAHSACKNDHPSSKKRAESLENCLPEAERSVFVAELTLNDGNIVQQGGTLKGRVTVRSVKQGLTTMSRVSVSLRSRRRDHWALAQAAASDDAEFINACQGHRNDRVLDAESERFAHVFQERDENQQLHSLGRFQQASASQEISSGQSSFTFDFDFEVPREIPVDFDSYYRSSEASLSIDLTTLYPLDIVKGRSKSGQRRQDGRGTLGPTHPVGKPLPDRSLWDRTLDVQAKVPITVVSGGPAHPVVHYLAPGARTSVLRSGPQAEKVVSFPIAQPVFNVEAPANTSARLMQSGSTNPMLMNQQFLNISSRRSRRDYPNPTKDYRGGSFAGVLWKKKVVAEERGLWPLPNEINNGGDAQQQQPFVVEV
ncbi:hypothetical protein B0H16DRAFT_1801813 [Mycena metata]|uniref:Uncharacterized protein n=1 Tax=Mycena metata TaxID=1033252 RepID=A0AAD7HAW3_9AGAR|nr:hypothetical protein B0H16DRAFT_1801813 [Mycena metata]